MVVKAISPQFLWLSSPYQNHELLKDGEIHCYSINVNIFQMCGSSVAIKRDFRKLSSTN